MSIIEEEWVGGAVDVVVVVDVIISCDSNVRSLLASKTNLGI